MLKWSILLVFALSISPAVEASDKAEASTPPTVCPAAQAGPAWSKGGQAPIAGVPLWFGVKSGMTEAEVRRVDPRLMGRSPRFGFVLFPGLPVEATANFDRRHRLASSISMHGVSHGSDIQAALTARYGRPKIIGALGRYLDIPIAVTGSTRVVESYAFKWCDDARQFEMNGGPEDFWLSVSPIER